MTAQVVPPVITVNYRITVPGATLVRKIHVEELRSRLSAALSALALPPLTLTDPALTTATSVRVEHIQELRNAAK